MGRYSKSINLADPEATNNLAKAMAGLLVAGDVVLLEGEIGAGKTHFARAFIQTRLNKSGMSEEIPSPTYTIVQTYWDGLVEIWHADLYRLSEGSEVYELGLIDAFQDAICLVEWPKTLDNLTPTNALHLHFMNGESENHRILKIDCDRAHWAEVIALVEAHHDF